MAIRHALRRCLRAMVRGARLLGPEGHRELRAGSGVLAPLPPHPALSHTPTEAEPIRSTGLDVQLLAPSCEGREPAWTG